MSNGVGIEERLSGLRERLRRAALGAGRDPAGVELVGVSKRKPAADIVAAVRAGLAAVGENYVQEAVAKLPSVLTELQEAGVAPPRWHFIGQLQRNKARVVVQNFDVVETVDRESLGFELDRRARQAGRHLDILLQVNLSGEAQKGGVDPRALGALFEASRSWPQLEAIGLMTVPAASTRPEESRPAFRALRELRDGLREKPGGDSLRELSMGMSADFEVAVEEGATIVRIGSAIFGAREV